MRTDPIDIMLNQWTLERPDLDTSALAVVVRILLLHKTFLRQATKALLPVDLELWEYDVLSALRRQGKPYELAATELARQTAISTGAMTNRIDRLAERELVSRAADLEDRRSVNVALTSKGVRVIDKAIQLRLDAANHGVRGLSGKERVALAKLLRKVVLAATPSAAGNGKD
jgi:DNA-binding MarR family transcriptional regulator